MMNTIKNIIVPFLFLLLFAGCDENVFQPTDLETVGRVRINVSLKGDPVSGAKVCVYNNLLIRNLDGTNCNESILDSVTNSLGFVEFNLPGDSTYFITVVSEVEGVTFNNLNSHPNNVISTENARHEDDLEIVDIELFTISDLAQLDNSTRLRLTVRDEADFPLANATVCLYKNQSFQEANAPGCQGSLVQGTTNADGQVLFSNLDPVRYFVNTSAEVGVLFLDNTQNSSAEVMTLQSNILNEQDIILRPRTDLNASLKVVVQGPSGNPLPGANVCIYDDAGRADQDMPFCTNSLRASQTDQNGTVVFTRLDTIKYYINVNAIVNDDTLSNISTVRSTGDALGFGEVREVIISVFED